MRFESERVLGELAVLGVLDVARKIVLALMRLNATIFPLKRRTLL
jgi:hypothetical protein